MNSAWLNGGRKKETFVFETFEYHNSVSAIEEYDKFLIESGSKTLTTEEAKVDIAWFQ